MLFGIFDATDCVEGRLTIQDVADLPLTKDDSKLVNLIIPMLFIPIIKTLCKLCLIPNIPGL